MLETPVVVRDRENFKTAPKSVGRQTLRKQFVSGRRKMTASRVIPKKSAKKSVGREETFSQTFLLNHVERFSVPSFFGSFSKSWRECSIS